MMQPLKLDARTKALVVLVAGFFVFWVSDIGLYLLMIFLSGYLLSLGKFKAAPKFILAFLVTDFLQRFTFGYEESVIMATIAFFAYFQVRLIPLFMAGMVLSQTPPGELIAALQKCKVPRVVVIPLAVGLRFIPTIRQEFLMIMDVMKLRGIAPTVWNLWRHPILTFEYLLVPLVIRSLTIADDISMAAVTRGIENPGLRTSLREIKFKKADYIVITLSLIWVGVVFYVS